MNAYNPSAPLPPGLVDYVVARPGEELPPIRAGFYEYVLAGNGVFVRGRFTVQTSRLGASNVTNDA